MFRQKAIITVKLVVAKAALTKSQLSWKLDIQGDFDAKQVVLRTQLRVKNNREEPIDYLSKVILTCFDLMPLSPEFCQGTNPEYLEPYSILDVLSKEGHQQLISQIKEF